MSKDTKTLLEKLRELKWPQVYMFKFIVPNDNKKLALVEALFNDSSQISIRQSSTGKFISVTGKELMLNPENVIKRYEEANKIEGLIAL